MIGARSWPPRRVELALRMEGLQSVFAKLDVDGDGNISKTEIMSGLSNDVTLCAAVGINLPFTASLEERIFEVGQLFGGMDKDGDGTVDEAEFLRFLGYEAPEPQPASEPVDVAVPEVVGLGHGMLISAAGVVVGFGGKKKAPDGKGGFNYTMVSSEASPGLRANVPLWSTITKVAGEPVAGAEQIIQRLGKIQAGKSKVVFTVEPLMTKSLAEATAKGMLDEVERHLKKGASPNQKGADGYCVLHTAAYSGHREIVGRLLDKGANVAATTSLGATPLHAAAGMGCVEALQMLLWHGADIGARTHHGGDTALHWAAKDGKLEACRILLGAGADPAAKNRFGKTPLAQAQARAEEDVCDLLRDEAAIKVAAQSFRAAKATYERR